MEIEYKKMSDRQLNLIEEYCKNDLKKLKQICHFVWANKGLPSCDHDELYDDAMKVLSESVWTFNFDEKVQFNTFLTNNIRLSYREWYRNNYLRAKRNNLAVDKNGKIIKDEKGNPIIIKNVSLDEPANDNQDLKDKIPAKENIKDEELSPQMREYLNKLSRVQRKILMYLSEGYTQEEIQELLHINRSLYRDSVMAIMNERNIKHIRNLLRR